MERYSKFEELKEKRNFKHEGYSEANLFEKEVIAFIELLKKSVVIERKDVGNKENSENKSSQNGK